jgi:predicted nucleotidyltransferase
MQEPGTDENPTVRGAIVFDLEPFKPRIADLCRRVNVSRLDVFGSATDASFSDESDVDVLVRFERDGGLFNRYFDLKEGLEEILGRPVDVIIEDAVRNPYFRAGIERSRKNVYAA